ncbi:hypothetical protein REPUB_Repub11eG0160300 [Reevesia pubescens]
MYADDRRDDNSDPSSTIFVENLPDNVSTLKLKSLFGTFGDIKDVFIAKKKSRSQKVFGFIKFVKSEDARNAVQGLQGRSIHGFCVSLNIAKYNRQRKPYTQFKEWTMPWNSQVEGRAFAIKKGLKENFKRPGVTFKDALMLDKDLKLKKKEDGAHKADDGSCLGFLNHTCIAWLRCSVVVITRTEESTISVQNKLQNSKIDFVKVRKVESRIFLITFANSEQLWN